MKNEMSILNCASVSPNGVPLTNCIQVVHWPANDEPGEQAEHRHADDEDQLAVRVEGHPVTVGAAAATEHAGTEHRPHPEGQQHVAADDADHEQRADEEQQRSGSRSTPEKTAV